MPRTSAARRASWASSSVQQPRAPCRSVAGAADSARCTPVTSYPASTARAAATAESTPPLMAARTLIRGPRGIVERQRSDFVGCASRRRDRGQAGLAGPLRGGADGGDGGADVLAGRGRAEGEPQG